MFGLGVLGYALISIGRATARLPAARMAWLAGLRTVAAEWGGARLARAERSVDSEVFEATRRGREAPSLPRDGMDADRPAGGVTAARNERTARPRRA